MDLDWITSSLAIGGRLADGAAAALAREHRVRAVVDLRAEARDDEALLRRHGIALLHLPTEDHRAVAPAMLWAGVRWVGDELDRGGRVLCHCEHGIGRSALLAACVLVSRGSTPREAIALAKRARPVVSPSPEQLTALLAWSAEWHRAGGRPAPAQSWDEVADVAYGRAPPDAR